MKGEPTTNARLVQEALEGSEEAFFRIVEIFGPPLATFLYGLLKTREDVEEVSQMAFYRAFRRLDRLENPEIFGAWLWRIAYCAAVDFQRKARRTVTEEVPATEDAWHELPGDDPGVEVFMERSSLIEEVRDQFRSLPEATQRILAMRYRDDMSYRDIGRTLDLTLVQVKARLARARRKLGGRIGDLAQDWRRLSDELS